MTARYEPFPALWREFPAAMLQGHHFDTLMDASRLLATAGADAARKVLSRRDKTITDWPQSSADLKTPDRPVSDELKQLLARGSEY